jgi:hypothetical protein
MNQPRKPGPYSQIHYLLQEEDLEKIDGLLNSLNLAIAEIFGMKQIRERGDSEQPCMEDFTSQVELITTEAELKRQLQFPWNEESDF